VASSIEREVKLAAGPGFHLPALDGLAVEVAALPVQEGRIETTYYDTEDLRLARWGCSLRFRQGEGWTLKLPDSADGRMLVRSEHTFAGHGRRVPAGASDLVRAYVRRSELRPAARLSTWRRKLRLVDAAGAELVEVVDDEVSVLDRRRVAARFREVEVELRPGGQAILDPLLARLAEAGAATVSATPKHVRALGPAAQEPPEAHAGRTGPHSTIGAVVQSAIAACAAGLLSHDPKIRVGGDPEDVHDARVAMRRLRSHLRFFGAILDGEWVASLTEEVAWLGGELGAVRDPEVLAERLSEEVGRLPAEDRRAGLGLAQRAAAEVPRRRSSLLESMSSDRYLDLVERLLLAAREPKLVGDPLQPAADVLPELARTPWDKLRKAVRRLGPNPANESLHGVRIRTKRARYAAEVCAPVLGDPAARFAKTAAQIQTALGDLQDSIVAQAWLRANAGTSRRAFVAGQLWELEAARGRAARDGWRQPWKQLRSAKSTRWLG
jgi:CHAD domain-containing protein